ncbi:MAG: hypothetical protein KC544_07480 [Gemmatimonadetes bacterium]|nr:hypothetical protein [Gemmatimonadota bacterium]
MNRSRWLERFAPSLSKEEQAALDPFALEAWRVARAEMAAIRRAAVDDARRTPIASPCLNAWRRMPDDRGPVWAAACWEAAARERATEDSRATCLEFSRAIIAAAKGDIAPFASIARDRG